MYEFDDVCLNYFLENQLQLFPEPVAESPEDAADFLDECMATICEDKKEVKQYFKETGADVTGITDFSQIAEVFPLPDGRFLIVDA